MDFHEPLPQQILDIDDKTRSNLFAWRGQFSPQLVASLLQAYAAPSATVLDPFMGSGTVLVEAARRGHTVFGAEINPAAWTISKLYELTSLSVDGRSKLVRHVDDVLRTTSADFDLPLLNSTCAPPRRMSQLFRDPSIPDDVRSVLEALVILADLDAPPAIDTHPWLALWKSVKERIVSLPFSSASTRALLADARSLPIDATSIDFVLTSPPYVNVFNYHHNYRGAAETLGWRPLAVARSEIGANRKFRQNRFLTVVQYAIDMSLFFHEMRRVMRPNARCLMVVGRESNVHHTSFYNASIVISVASDAGFVLRQRQARAFTNRFGQRIWEDLLSLDVSPVGDDSDPLRDGRRVGEEALRDARSRVPPDRMHYLDGAIEAVNDVEQSDLLKVSAIRNGKF